MENKRGKKGELTTEQIVLLVVLIISFVVILFFLFQLNLGGETAKDTCRNSVLLRGKSIFPVDTVQLSCYRSYKCVTNDGSCEGLNSPQIVKVDNINQVYSELASDMAECWWMFGEGKTDYLGGGDITKNNYCSICSQILFDNSLTKIDGAKDGKISKEGLYAYMSQNKLSGQSLTYLEYFFGTNDLQKIKQTAQSQFGTSNFGTIETSKQFFLVMGITSKVSSFKWAGGGVAAGAGVLGVVSIVTGPPGWIIGGIVLGSGAAAGVGVAQLADLRNPEVGGIIVSGQGVDNTFMTPTIVEANSDKFRALNCEDVLTYS